MGRGPGVRAVGEEAIQIDFRWNGVRCRERIRLPSTRNNLKYVARLKATIEHEIATGTFVYARHFPDSRRARVWDSGHATIAAALQAYVVSLAGSVEPETARDYRRDAAIVAGWFGKDKTLRSLTRAELRREIAKQNLSKQRLDNLLRPLRGAFAQAVEDDPTHPNPLVGFKVRRISAPKDDTIDPFTPDELEKLASTESGNLWTFWAWTGLRSGEVIGLRWAEVDGQCASLAIRRAVRLGREKRPKTRAGERRLVLLPAARAALSRIKRVEDGPVFVNPRTGRDWHEAKALNREFARACRAAKVRYRYVYQLRHTFATWGLSSGENPLWVARMMGHKDTAMLYRHYAKWMPSLDPKAGSKMAKAAGGQRAA